MKSVPQQRRSTHAGRSSVRVSQRPGLGRWLAIALFVAAALALPKPAHAQVGPQRLLLQATTAEEARYSLRARPATPGVARQKPVALDVRQFVDRQKATAADLHVELFDAQSVTLTPERLERRADGNYTWHGKLKDHPNGFALITVVDGQVSGMIDLGEGGARSRYRLQSTADGLTLLQEIDAATFPEDHPGAAELVAPTPVMAPSGGIVGGQSTGNLADAFIAKADTAATIDVMIVYSNQTAASAGTAIGAQAQQAVDTANLVYANSGITTRLRLVYAGPANYDESGDFTTDLNRLTSGTDGYMDNVAALRETYGADLVSLFVENPQYCGLGWIGPSAGYAFTVVNRSCASSNLSFPHELGHNFGARHDTYVDAATTPYAYGHGWVDIAQGWRDVMAYNNACAASGVSCTRIPYLSNPNMTYTNDLLGSTATADTVRVHNQNALTIANFRASAQGGTSCTYALAPSAASVAATAGSGSIGITTQAGCVWNPTSNAAWLTAASSASGAGTLSYSFAANTGAARSGTITIGGVAFTVTQAAGCTYSLSGTSAAVAASGGSGTTTLSAAAGCTWSASSSAAWLTLSSPASGSGGATVSYVAAANTGSARSANLTIAGMTFVVSQAAATAQAPAAATLTPTALDLGTVIVGKTSGTQSSTIQNTGGSALTISALTMGGANPAEFTRKGTCVASSILAAGASCTVSITFKPAAVGTRSASVGVATSAGSLTLAVTGTGKTRR